MDSIKTLVWSIMAIFFAFFSIYGYKISKEFEKLEKKSEEPRKVRTSNSFEIITEIENIYKDFYNLNRKVSVVGSLGFLLSAIAAILSLI